MAYAHHITPKGLSCAPEHNVYPLYQADVCSTWCAINQGEYYTWAAIKSRPGLLHHTPEALLYYVSTKAKARYFLTMARKMRTAS